MTFRILESQMRALGRQTQAQFVDKMEAYLREHLPEHVAAVGDERLHVWTVGALAVAHAANIHTEPEAAQLILLLTVLGLDAEKRHEWVREALEEDLLPSGKISKLITDGAAREPQIASVIVYPDYQALLDRALDRALEEELAS